MRRAIKGGMAIWLFHRPWTVGLGTAQLQRHGRGSPMLYFGSDLASGQVAIVRGSLYAEDDRPHETFPLRYGGSRRHLKPCRPRQTGQTTTMFA